MILSISIAGVVTVLLGVILAFNWFRGGFTVPRKHMGLIHLLESSRTHIHVKELKGALPFPQRIMSVEGDSIEERKVDIKPLIVFTKDDAPTWVSCSIMRQTINVYDRFNLAGDEKELNLNLVEFIQQIIREFLAVHPAARSRKNRGLIHLETTIRILESDTNNRWGQKIVNIFVGSVRYKDSFEVLIQKKLTEELQVAFETKNIQTASELADVVKKSLNITVEKAMNFVQLERNVENIQKQVFDVEELDKAIGAFAKSAVETWKAKTYEILVP